MSSLMEQIFTGGAEDIQDGADFFWQVRREKMKPEQVERVLAYWEAALAWATAQPTVNEISACPSEPARALPLSSR